MKKNLTRILALVLIAMMLIPTIVTLVASAEETGEETTVEINNLYDPETATKNAQPSDVNMTEIVAKAGETASAPIAVKRGDSIYVGPCPPPTEDNAKKLVWVVSWYKADGTYAGQKKYSELGTNVVDTFADGSVIYKILVTGSNYKYACLRTSSTYHDCIVMTVNQAFTKADYYAHADANGWDIESAGLRPIPPKMAPEAPVDFEGIWNYFPRETDRDDTMIQHQNNTYVMSGFIPVDPGDVITMGAISTAETRSILYTYDEEFKEIRNYKRTDSTEIQYVENLGYNFATYSYTIPEKSESNPDAKEVAYVKICTHSGIYNDGDILVTKNQPFNAAELRATLEIAELSDEAKAHPFYGKNALFVGDSISYGSYDTPPTYRNPSASWARRLAQETGLIPNNVSYPGASVGKTGLTNVKWEYDLLKIALMSKKQYQMIVFQGGVNDARQDVAVGTAMPADTDRKVLVEDERLATFAGGLQLMFHDAKNQWPEAELYYIANFKLVSESVKGKDMEEYFAQARILCAEYGVHYIDLYNDVELYETFDYTSETVLPDLIHPTTESYDLLFPAILRLFNATISEEPDVPGNPGETDPEETTPEVTTPEVTTPEVTTPVTPNEGGDNQEEPKGLSTGAIIGIAAGVVAVAVGGFALYWFVLKKKK